MHTFQPGRRAVVALAIGLACIPLAHAGPPGPSDPPAPAAMPATSAHDATQTPTVPAWQPVALSQLDGLRGGDGAESNVLIDGLVDGNTAENIETGDNLLGGGAFGHASGINTVIQNSGSNVLIQSGTAVSVQFSSPTP